LKKKRGERERGDSHGGNLRHPRRHHSSAYGREGTPVGVAQRGWDSGDWTTMSYKRRKAIRPGDQGQDRPRNSSRHGGYREDRFYSSGRRHQNHSRDSRYFSCDSRVAGELGFPHNNNRFHSRHSHSRSHHHHSRPGYYQHGPSHHHSRTERGRSCIRHGPHSRHASISIPPSVISQE